MVVRPRSARLGGIVVGVAALLALGAARTWWWGPGSASGCPRALAVSAPATIEDAARLIALCGAEDVRRRLQSASLPDVMSHRSPDLPPAVWFARASPLHRALSGIGFEHADDMSFAVLSAAWHRGRGLPFDAATVAACLRAWNLKMRLWIESVPPGSQIPAPEFNCASADEIEKGRPLWPKE